MQSMNLICALLVELLDELAVCGAGAGGIVPDWLSPHLAHHVLDLWWH